MHYDDAQDDDGARINKVRREIRFDVQGAMFNARAVGVAHKVGFGSPVWQQWALPVRLVAPTPKVVQQQCNFFRIDDKLSTVDFRHKNVAGEVKEIAREMITSFQLHLGLHL